MKRYRIEWSFAKHNTLQQYIGCAIRNEVYPESNVQQLNWKSSTGNYCTFKIFCSVTLPFNRMAQM